MSVMNLTDATDRPIWAMADLAVMAVTTQTTP